MNVSRGIKKPRVRMKSINSSKTQKLSGFFDYLTQRGHQTANDEIPQVFTNIENATATGIKDFMDQYEKIFVRPSKKKSSGIIPSCWQKAWSLRCQTGMTNEEIEGYVKAITKALPDYMTFAFRGSSWLQQNDVGKPQEFTSSRFSRSSW